MLRAFPTTMRARLSLALHPRAGAVPLGLGRRAYSDPALPNGAPRSKKVWDSVDEAVSDIKSGDTLLSGGAWPFVAYNILSVGSRRARTRRVRLMRNTRCASTPRVPRTLG